MQGLKTVKQLYTIITICFITIGFVLLIWPQIGLNLICKIVGVFLITHGVLRLAGYFSRDLFQLAFQFDLGLGILSFILGLLMIFKSTAFINIISSCIGIFMVVDAALRIQTAIEAKKFGIAKWWGILAIAIVVAIIGALLLFIPFKTVSVITRLMGLCLGFDGILNLIVIRTTVQTIRSEKDIIDID